MARDLHGQSTAPLPPARRFSAPAPTGRMPAWALPLGLGLVVVLVGVSLATAGYVLYQRDRVLPGVHVADVDLGGLSEPEAAARLSSRLEAYARQPLTLAAGGASWQVPARDLGVSYDVPAMVDAAMRAGRSGPSTARVAAWWPLDPGPKALPPVGQVDQATLLRGLGPALTSLNQPAIDSTIDISPEAGLRVRPAASGQTLDLAAVTLAVRERAARLSTEPVALEVRPVPPLVTEERFRALSTAAEALLSRPLELRVAGQAGGATRAIPPADLARMLTLTGPEASTLALDPGDLAAYLGGLAPEIDRASRDAEVALDTAGAVTLTPHVEGVHLDVAASAAAINEAVARQQHTAALVTRAVAPAVTTAMLAPVRDDLTRLLDRTIQINAADTSARLTPKELALYLTLEPRQGAPAPVGIAVNGAAVEEYLAGVAKKVKREARPPVLKYLNGQVTRTAEPVQGRELDGAAALTALERGLLDAATGEVVLPVKTIDAPLAQIDPSQIVIRDVLAEGVTAYGFSLPERKHNVELATQRLNGTLIAPGEVFSFNRAVGRVNVASGYQTGYGIVLTNGAVQTVPSVGGGICQVATTVFHAAFRAGMPIMERNWHFYWIPTYGQAPSGMTGLDATVDEDYGLDFTFRNTTGNWLALLTSYDGQNIRMQLKGVAPGWQVRVDGPAISNVKPHDPTPVEREDATLPAGRRVQVESARDGMDVAITRTVSKDGQVIDQRTFKSHYAPSQNVTLVGTRQ